MLAPGHVHNGAQCPLLQNSVVKQPPQLPEQPSVPQFFPAQLGVVPEQVVLPEQAVPPQEGEGFVHVLVPDVPHNVAEQTLQPPFTGQH